LEAQFHSNLQRLSDLDNQLVNATAELEARMDEQQRREEDILSLNRQLKQTQNDRQQVEKQIQQSNKVLKDLNRTLLQLGVK
jgi:peptidoglycan hydrolase CwlO-like protein